jgi:hypothetical protein
MLDLTLHVLTPTHPLHIQEEKRHVIPFINNISTPLVYLSVALIFFLIVKPS